MVKTALWGGHAGPTVERADPRLARYGFGQVPLRGDLLKHELAPNERHPHVITRF